MKGTSCLNQLYLRTENVADSESYNKKFDEKNEFKVSNLFRKQSKNTKLALNLGLKFKAMAIDEIRTFTPLQSSEQLIDVGETQDSPKGSTTRDYSSLSIMTGI